MRTVMVAYLRVSSEDQSLDRQRAGITKFWQQRYSDEIRNGLHLWFIEEKQSTLKVRPELEKLIKDAERGEYTHIFFWELSRMGRTVKELIRNMERLDKAKVNWFAIKENIDSFDNSAFSKFKTLMIAAMAQLERDLMSERIKEGIAAKRARGEEVGGSTKRKIVNRDMVIEMISGGASYREIGKAMGVSIAFISRLVKLMKAKQEEEIDGKGIN